MPANATKQCSVSKERMRNKNKEVRLIVYSTCKDKKNKETGPLGSCAAKCFLYIMKIDRPMNYM